MLYRIICNVLRKEVLERRKKGIIQINIAYGRLNTPLSDLSETSPCHFVLRSDRNGLT
jgi:hypothetical protein